MSKMLRPNTKIKLGWLFHIYVSGEPESSQVPASDSPMTAAKVFMETLHSEFSAEEVVFERGKGPLKGKCFVFQHGVMALCREQLTADVSHRMAVVLWSLQGYIPKTPLRYTI